MKSYSMEIRIKVKDSFDFRDKAAFETDIDYVLIKAVCNLDIEEYEMTALTRHIVKSTGSILQRR